LNCRAFPILALMSSSVPPDFRHTKTHLEQPQHPLEHQAVLLYDAETWRRTKLLDKKLQVFVNNCLRQIIRIRWPDKISNQELWARTKQQSIINTITKKVEMDWPHVTMTAIKHCQVSLGLESTGPKETRKTHKLLAQDS